MLYKDTATIVFMECKSNALYPSETNQILNHRNPFYIINHSLTVYYTYHTYTFLEQLMSMKISLH